MPLNKFEFPVGDPELAGAAEWRDTLLSVVNAAVDDGACSDVVGSIAREAIWDSWGCTEDPRDTAWNVLQTEIDEMIGLQHRLNSVEKE